MTLYIDSFMQAYNTANTSNEIALESVSRVFKNVKHSLKPIE